MIQVYIGDRGKEGSHHVRGVEPATQPDLDDGDLDTHSVKQVEGEACRRFEERQGVTPDFRIELPRETPDVIIPDWISSDLKTLPEGAEVR